MYKLVIILLLLFFLFMNLKLNDNIIIISSIVLLLLLYSLFLGRHYDNYLTYNGTNTPIYSTNCYSCD